jgi:acyl carrier protein
MGLDAVELVIRFEDAFGIGIPDEVAAQLTTPREVAEYVLTQVAVGDQSACLSQQAFYFLREKFVRHLNIPRRAFSPASPLEQLIPRENRKSLWASVRADAGVRVLPGLARPLWLFYSLALVTVSAFVYGIIWAGSEVGGGLSFLFGLLAASAAGYAGAVLTRPLKINFRRGYERVGGLAKYLAASKPHVFKRDQRTWTREQVAQVIRHIIIDEAGRTDFTEDSHFINDLHLD